MEELLHVVGISVVGIMLDASKEIDAERVIIAASLQVRVADIIGRPRVHGGGGGDNEVEVGRVGERSRDIIAGPARRPANWLMPRLAQKRMCLESAILG